MKVVMGCLMWALMGLCVAKPVCAQEKLERIEICALNIASRYQIFLSVPMILQNPNRHEDTIRDSEFLAAIADRLLKALERRIETPVGHPTIVCFVHWRGRAQRDTLIFGQGAVWYEGNWRTQDPVLLWLVSVRFPQEYLQGVIEEIMACQRLRRLLHPNEEE